MSTPRKPVTLGEAVAAFLNTLTPSTRRSYATALDALADEYGPGKALASLDPAAVAAWFTARWEGRSASTWNLRLASLRAAVAWWTEREWEAPDITGRLKNRRARRVLPSEVLTEDELRAMLAQCSLRADTGIRNRALITVMYRAGLRVSEALALRVSDIDMSKGTVNVRSGKGAKQRGEALDDGSLAIIQRWLDKRRELGIRANGHPLFCTLKGGPLDSRQVRATVTRIARKAGIEKRAHPHGLRHSYTAELVAEGVPVNVIQDALGHEHLATTGRYTRHIAPAEVIAMGRSRKPFSESGKPAGPAGERDMEAEVTRLQEQVASLLAGRDNQE